MTAYSAFALTGFPVEMTKAQPKSSSGHASITRCCLPLMGFSFRVKAHVKTYAQMIWDHEADRYRRIPGRLYAVSDGNPNEVARVVRKAAES
jgi:hypothetical protein